MTNDWIERNGDDCPVRHSAIVDIKWSDGVVECGYRADRHQWRGFLPQSKERITHYRVVSA